MFQERTTQRKRQQKGHDLSILSAPSVVGCLDRLLGQTYHVGRPGQSAEFTLEFLALGRLIVNLEGQRIEEFWKPATLCDAAVCLGGRTMPKAEVVIGAQQFQGQAFDLWEPSPPNGAMPLLGKLIGQKRQGVEPEPEPTSGVATKLELIVDRSGSMQPLHAATVEGLNSFLRDQRGLPHAHMITMRLVVFDNQIETCWPEGTHLSDPNLTVTSAMVQPRGQTALLDAIGVTLVNTPLSPPRVVCIVTDGHENSSRRFSRHQVNELITARQTAGWTFIFLAANQEAIAEGAKFGINAGNCATFSANAEGIAGGFGSSSAAACRGSMFGSAAATFTASERAACLTGKQ